MFELFYIETQPGLSSKEEGNDVPVVAWSLQTIAIVFAEPVTLTTPATPLFVLRLGGLSVIMMTDFQYKPHSRQQTKPEVSCPSVSICAIFAFMLLQTLNLFSQTTVCYRTKCFCWPVLIMGLVSCQFLSASLILHLLIPYLVLLSFCLALKRFLWTNVDAIVRTTWEPC